MTNDIVKFESIWNDIENNKPKIRHCLKEKQKLILNMNCTSQLGQVLPKLSSICTKRESNGKNQISKFLYIKQLNNNPISLKKVMFLGFRGASRKLVTVPVICSMLVAFIIYYLSLLPSSVFFCFFSSYLSLLPSSVL